MRRFGAGVVVVDDVPSGWVPLLWPERSPPPEPTPEDVAHRAEMDRRTIARLADIRAGRGRDE